MTRFGYRLYRWAAGLHYQLPRRFTKGGLLAMMGALLTGAVGSDIDQSVAFQTFALLFCLLVVALLWALTFRGRFRVERALPRLASVGQTFRYQVTVQNHSARSYRGLELIEDLAEPFLSLEDLRQTLRTEKRFRTFRLSPSPGVRLDLPQAIVRPTPLNPVGAGRTVEAQIEVLPLRRGPLRLSGATVARQDPLGLVRGFVRLPIPQTVLVLPRRYPVPPLGFLGTRHYQPGGVALASSIGESEEFVSLRDYRPGDPFRRIHWRSWARTGRAIVKEYQDEFFVRHGLVLDTMASRVPARVFEEAVSVAASFACTIETQESLLDLLFVGAQAFCFTTGRGLGRPEQVLEILASVRPCEKTTVHSLRDLVLRHAPLLSACICVFVDWDEDRAELVRGLKALELPVVVLVVSGELTQEEIQRRGEGCGRVHLLRPGRLEEDLQALKGAGA